MITTYLEKFPLGLFQFSWKLVVFKEVTLNSSQSVEKERQFCQLIHNNYVGLLIVQLGS